MQTKSFVMITSDRSECTADVNVANRIKFLRKVKALIGTNPVSALGVWQNEQEVSYQVPVANMLDVYMLIGIARQFNQDAVLHVKPDHSAVLYDLRSVDNQSQTIGQWSEVDGITAREDDAGYTFLNNKYYTVK